MYSAAQRQECLINLLTYLLRVPGGPALSVIIRRAERRTRMWQQQWIWVGKGKTVSQILPVRYLFIF